MIVVADSSFLIGLAKLKKLHLLASIFSAIYIPTSVYREAVEAGGEREDSRDIAACDFIITKDISDKRAKKLLDQFIGEGEAEVLVLAKEIDAHLILLDDARARKMARHGDFEVIGIAGFLVLAKKLGLIDKIRPLVEELKIKGFYLGERFIERLLIETGEIEV